MLSSGLLRPEGGCSPTETCAFNALCGASRRESGRDGRGDRLGPSAISCSPVSMLEDCACPKQDFGTVANDQEVRLETPALSLLLLC